jgi:hypothetical protein
MGNKKEKIRQIDPKTKFRTNPNYPTFKYQERLIIGYSFLASLVLNACMLGLFSIQPIIPLLHYSIIPILL